MHYGKQVFVDEINKWRDQSPHIDEKQAHSSPIMARHNNFVMLAVLAYLVGLAFCQEQILVQNAKQNNLVDIQFFADSNFQQTRTPFAYFDFPAIQQGSCTQCENFQVLSAIILSSEWDQCADSPVPLYFKNGVWLA